MTTWRDPKGPLYLSQAGVFVDILSFLDGWGELLQHSSAARQRSG